MCRPLLIDVRHPRTVDRGDRETCKGEVAYLFVDIGWRCFLAFTVPTESH